ncbi:unnamed protein product, partial [Ectocarpus sp. 12 AP-2014]
LAQVEQELVTSNDHSQSGTPGIRFSPRYVGGHPIANVPSFSSFSDSPSVSQQEDTGRDRAKGSADIQCECMRGFCDSEQRPAIPTGRLRGDGHPHQARR